MKDIAVHWMNRDGGGGQSTIKLTVEEVRDKRRNKGYLDEGYFSAMLHTFYSIRRVQQ